MLDKFNRKINYLRISVTDKCNQRCYYCMPKGEINFIKIDHILSYEEIFTITKSFVDKGINKVRLTGGEPLLRKNIISLVSMLSELKGITDLSMTTNGTLLSKYAKQLKQNGLNRINVSLDSINHDHYKEITSNGNLNDVLDGLNTAKEVGFKSIKINCVIKKSSDEQNAKEVAEFALKNGFKIRFIRMMNMEKGEFWPVDGGDGGNCKTCNRLRLSSDGRIFPCLFCDKSFSIKELGIDNAIEQSIKFKPESGDKALNKFHLLGG